MWQSLCRLASKAGWEVAHRGFLAYYLLKDPDVPASEKGSIAAAIAYLISPLDAVPDFLVGVGFVDDLAVLVALIVGLERFVTPEIRQQAEEAASAVFSTK